jgi:hypothetical protein
LLWEVNIIIEGVEFRWHISKEKIETK